MSPGDSQCIRRLESAKLDTHSTVEKARRLRSLSPRLAAACRKCARGV